MINLRTALTVGAALISFSSYAQTDFNFVVDKEQAGVGIQRGQGFSPTAQNDFPTSKELLFKLPSDDPTWWSKLQGLEYSEQIVGNNARLYQASYAVKEILVKEYGASVPFDPSRVGPSRSAGVISKALQRRPVVGDWCPAMTSVLLGSMLSAATALLAPEYIFPGADPQGVKSKADNYLRVSGQLLIHYCKDNPSANFLPAFGKFLNDYKVAVNSGIVATRERVKAADEEKRVAESKQQAIAAEKEAKLQKQRDEAAAEREKRDQALKAKRLEEEKQAAEARAKADEDRKQYIADLKSKKRPVQSIKDAIAYYDAKYGYGVVRQPPVVPDNKAYVVQGKLIKKSGNQYVFEINDGDIYYYYANIPSSTPQHKDFQFKFDGLARIVGILVGTAEYRTVAGNIRNAAVFDVKFAGPWEIE